MTSVRRAGVLAALAAAPFAAAWRFALVYRVRAGFPRANPPRITPADLALPFEPLDVDSAGARLPGWFIPARDGAPGPGVALVHGWESARDRTLPLAQVLNAVGLHVLTVDVRGHGANGPESLPVTAAEFGRDAGAAFDALLARPEVTEGAIAGHSMGGIGAILAAAADARVRALVVTSAPADPWRLTRETFRLAGLPIPDPIAYPLAWLTTRVFLEPRGHRVEDVDASRAIGRFRGPVLLLHGESDEVVPVAHLARLERAARASRAADDAPVETLVVPGGQHSWLYEVPVYRRAIGRFLAEHLDGPLAPAQAGDVASGVRAMRIPDARPGFSALGDDLARRRRTATGGLGALPGLPDEEPPIPDGDGSPRSGPDSTEPLPLQAPTGQPT